jgi:hypothetical protein
VIIVMSLGTPRVGRATFNPTEHRYTLISRTASDFLHGTGWSVHGDLNRSDMLQTAAKECKIDRISLARDEAGSDGDEARRNAGMIGGQKCMSDTRQSKAC